MSETQSAPSINIFISYSRVDEKFCIELNKHLNVLERLGMIHTHHDRQISPGSEWSEDLEEKLEASNVFLFLVSPDLLSSSYINDVELKYAMNRHHENTAIVIPIIVRKCLWKKTSFSGLQALPTDGRPVNSDHWHSHDDAWKDIMDGLFLVLEKHGEKNKNIAPEAPTIISDFSISNDLQSYYENKFLFTFIESALTPAYFLDRNFNFMFMNTAAKIVFELEYFSWVGKNLSHLFDEIQDRLVDFDTVKQRLASQMKEIKELEDSKWSRYIPPHFETVKITTKHGDIDMEKCGIPIKDDSTGEVIGWVVLYHLREFPEQILQTLIERVRGIIEHRHNPIFIAPDTN